VEPTSGEVLFRRETGEVVDIAKLDPHELKALRRNAQMIFQDPYSSLNPRWTLLQIVGEPLVAHGVTHGRDLEERVADLLRRVGLRPEFMRRYPHAFSGGERQRIGIARALALRPSFVVADEPVSALDVSVRAQTLNLLADLQAEFHLTYLFISHDLSVVQYICDRVAVMYVGKLVEIADTEQLYFNPKHPYTEALLSAVPKTDPDLPSRRIILDGEVPDSSRPPTGCYFHPRCRYAVERCRVEAPGLEEIEPNHYVACHRAGELGLEGVPDEPAIDTHEGAPAWPNGSPTK
jgi:peptide/nickel transport system ATP-binding protein